MRILLVEDDESIVEVVTAILNEQNYVVDVAADGEAGWQLVEAVPYDLVLLDIVLPKLDGIAFCRKLRSQKKQVLVMLLTAQDKTTDKLLGLDAGADDYVVKPFDVQELAARIRALLRRGSSINTPILSCGQIQLDPSACEITCNGQPLRFSRKEYLLLELFLRHQHRVFSRSAIVDQIWSFNEDPPNEDTVKSHIKSIRRKLDAVGAGDVIETLYGQGYRINPAYLSATESAKATSDDTIAKQQALQISMTEIWQRTKDTSLKRVSFLEQVVQVLQTESLDQETQQKAAQTAHKLAGSLGTFGFEAGSQIAHQLEHLLQTELNQLTLPKQRQAALQIEHLIKTLQHTLADQASPESAFDSSTPALAQNRAATAPLLLILDSDQGLTQAITAQASEQNWRTQVATTAEIAQKQCQQERPDVALIDFSLLQDDQQGRMLLSDLQKQLSVPIVFLSAQASARDRVAAVQAGGQLFLKKPLPVAAILQAVLRLLHLSEVACFKVLVVDDDPLSLTILSSCLDLQEIQLTGLEDSTQFWETLSRVKPDLLILDVNMPNINGLELCQTVRHDFQWNWLPIVFLTAQTDEQTQRQVFAVGADDLITKPVLPDELTTCICNHLRRAQLIRLGSSAELATVRQTHAR